MVYVYAKLSKLNDLIGKKLSLEDIKETLSDMGMDTKGETEESDPEIKIEITAEKVDLVSSLGIARAIRFYRGLQKELPSYSLKKSGMKLFVKDTAKKSRPKTVAALLRDVPMDIDFLNEMIEIQEKIHDSFGRGRKKAAIGIYPMDAIEFPITYGAEDPKNIIFQPLEMDEKLDGHQILDKHDTGKKFAHLLKDLELYPVFRDNKGKVLSMPPIINSIETGKVEAHHKHLFIECSGFNITHLDNVLKILMTTFIDMGCKGESVEVEYESGEIYELDLRSYEEVVNIDYINSLIGFSIDEKQIKDLALKVMLNIKSIDDNNNAVFEVPCFRCDIWHDSDIADDIARAFGYNNIQLSFPNVSSIGKHLPFSQFSERFSDSLARLGFIELYTYMLTSSQVQYKMMGTSEKECVKLIDSADKGINMVRTSIIPEILSSLRINRRNKYPQKVFENGITIQYDSSADVGFINSHHLCSVIVDSSADYTQIKGVFDTLFKLENINFEIKESELPFLIIGRQGEIFVNGKSVGFIGEIHPETITSFDLKLPASAFEIDLSRLYNLITKNK